MSVIFALLTKIRNDEVISVRSLVPILALVIYSFAGAGIVYAIERNHGCGLFADFWASLYFVNTVYTTIGYGNVHPCSLGGKVFFLVYAIGGIPLALYVLDILGQIMAVVAGALWTETSCFCCCISSCLNRRKDRIGDSSPDEEQKDKPKTTGEDSEEDEVLLPLWMGLVMTILWILLSAAFFERFEKTWSYLDALYFVLVSVTTVGFGDFWISSFQMAVADFLFIIIGMALFSLCINLVQQSLENLSKRMERNITEQYKESLKNGDGIPEGATVDDLLKEEGGVQRFLLSRKAKKELETIFEKAAGKRTAATQLNNTNDPLAVKPKEYRFPHQSSESGNVKPLWTTEFVPPVRSKHSTSDIPTQLKKSDETHGLESKKTFGSGPDNRVHRNSDPKPSWDSSFNPKVKRKSVYS